MSEEYKRICQECAEQGKALAQKLANDGIFEPLYLYARPSERGISGRLFLVRESAPNPYGYKLITGEPLRGNVPYQDYFRWVAEKAKRAPVLSID